MDFLLYEPEDFASNESYLRYYFRLNEMDSTFWQSWISNHPEKLDCIMNADQLISLLTLQLDESELSHEYQRLQSAINEHITEAGDAAAENLRPGQELAVAHDSPIDSGSRRTRFSHTILTVAAMLIIVASTYLYFFPIKRDSLLANFPGTAHETLLVKVNNGTAPLKFQLEDGTFISLQPGSLVNYPRNFLPEKREVFLEGEAFFEVSKNKNRPFYVYCQNLVAHVLGTSFTIKTDKLHGKIEVAVSTGKVEVYEKYKGVVVDHGNKSNGLILTPNQRAVYLEEDNKFEASLVEAPLPIAYVGQENKKDSTLPEVIYEKPTPMSEVLRSLAKDYGIEIEVENENLNNCHFYGPLHDMNLYLKLDAICQMVNASYEVKGTKILIKGIGCN